MINTAFSKRAAALPAVSLGSLCATLSRVSIPARFAFRAKRRVHTLTRRHRSPGVATAIAGGYCLVIAKSGVELLAIAAFEHTKAPGEEAGGLEGDAAMVRQALSQVPARHPLTGRPPHSTASTHCLRSGPSADRP